MRGAPALVGVGSSARQETLREEAGVAFLRIAIILVLLLQMIDKQWSMLSGSHGPRPVPIRFMQPLEG